MAPGSAKRFVVPRGSCFAVLEEMTQGDRVIVQPPVTPAPASPSAPKHGAGAQPPSSHVLLILQVAFALSSTE